LPQLVAHAIDIADPQTEMVEADKAAFGLFGEIGIRGTWAMKNITPPSFMSVRRLPFDINAIFDDLGAEHAL